MQVNALADQVVVLVKNALGPLVERIAGLEARLSVLGDLRDRVVVVETKAAMPVAPVDLAPIMERLTAAERRLAVLPDSLAGLETRLSMLGDLRDRVVTVETKAAMPLPLVDLSPLLERITALEQTQDKDASRLEGYSSALQRDAAALSERIAVLETRAPLPGPPGKDGVKGQDGVDGTPGKDGLAGLSFEGVYQDGQTYDKGNLVTWAGSSWHCNTATMSKPGESGDWTLMVKRGQNGRDGRDAAGALPIVSVGRAT